MKSKYTDYSVWPYVYLRDRAIEAFIESANGLAANYKPGRYIGEVCVLDRSDIGFEFNDCTMVSVCFTDMVDGTLNAFDLLPYDIDAKIFKCFGYPIPKEERNRHCAEYIDWAFSRTDQSPDYGWDMKAYINVYYTLLPTVYGNEITRLLKLRDVDDES